MPRFLFKRLWKKNLQKADRKLFTQLKCQHMKRGGRDQRGSTYSQGIKRKKGPLEKRAISTSDDSFQFPLRLILQIP